MDRRLVLAAAVVAGAVVVGYRVQLWRVAYPHLPRLAQAAPYLLRARLQLTHTTPVAVPTTSSALLEPVDLVAAPARAGTAIPLTTARTTVPTAQPSPSPTALPARVELSGVRHEYQTWNNCGPATISMALSYYGLEVNQAMAAQVLKPDPDDKNVGPEEMAAFARSLGLEALVRVNGDLKRLRALLALGVPVVVETWFIPRPGDEMGHYRVLVGYSDPGGRLVAADSYNGPRVELEYRAFDRLWRVFNRTYLVVYRPQQAAAVARVVGADLDDRAMYLAAAVRARAEIGAGEDAFGWFNLGSSLVGLGDTAAAAAAYDRARALGLPWRMLWYQFGPFEAYAAEGRWEDVEALAAANLRNAPNLEESLYWQGRALAAMGQPSAARRAWQRALHYNPSFEPARRALAAGAAGK